jgi:hypothetical protein
MALVYLEAWLKGRESSRPMAVMDAVEMNVPKQHEKLNRRGERQQTEYAVCFQMAHCKILVLITARCADRTPVSDVQHNRTLAGIAREKRREPMEFAILHGGNRSRHATQDDFHPNRGSDCRRH